MSKIVPKKNAPCIDFCGVDKYCYIIRSDLGCYMRSTNFHDGKDLQIFSLHNSCRGGDHYLAHEDGLFFIIKGNSYRCVSDMNRDSDAVVYILHPNCRGGDHYLSAFGKFYIIFQSKGIYRRVKNMNTDEDAAEFTLHPECKNGLYYWGTKNYYYFLKPCDMWGVQYCRSIDFQHNLDTVTNSFHADVVNILPGGIAISEGTSFGRWEALKTIFNESKSSIVWNKTITRKVGCEMSKTCSIEHNWQLSTRPTLKSGALAGALVKLQFSLPIAYGGQSVNTDQEQWSEATEVAESVNVTLQPNEKICIWQYVLGLGHDPALFCCSLKLTSGSKPPTDVPLPPSKQ